MSNGSRSVGYVLVCNKQFFKARFVTLILMLERKKYEKREHASHTSSYALRGTANSISLNLLQFSIGNNNISINVYDNH